MTITKKGISFPDIAGSKKIRNPHACFEATRCSLTCTSWPLPPGQRFNASGASFLVAPSARGSCWLGGEAGRQKQVLRSTPHLSSAHFLLMRCSPEAALTALVHALTAREDTSFQPGTSLLQVVAFSRALLKATLRLATGNTALQTPPPCASQQSVSHINARCL